MLSTETNLELSAEKHAVEMPGFEPGASYMRSKRSTTELHPPHGQELYFPATDNLVHVCCFLFFIILVNLARGRLSYLSILLIEMSKLKARCHCNTVTTCYSPYSMYYNVLNIPGKFGKWARYIE